MQYGSYFKGNIKVDAKMERYTMPVISLGHGRKNVFFQPVHRNFDQNL